MDRKLLIIAVAASFACWKGEASVGTCKVDADCGVNSTCNTSLHVCQYACPKLCAANEVCLGGNCVAQGPEVKQVMAPSTWSKRSQALTVTAVVDGSSGPGIESATLQIAGQPDIAGTTGDTGLVRNYSFAVPGSVQTAGSETPVEFTITSKDTAGRTSLQTAVGHGQLLIDDAGPLVNGVTVNLGTTVGGIKWFKAGVGPDITVDVSIQDAGSSVNDASLTLVSSGRLDQGTPTCGAGANAQTRTCRFSVPLSTVPVGSQQLINFAVTGSDNVGNGVKTNTAALGIDGKPPVITFTVGAPGSTSTTTYPPAFIDCNGGNEDTTMYCGHDGSHFWRAGDGKYHLQFTVSDDVGSGPDVADATGSIQGTSAVPASYDGSKFGFPADFATATFTSGSDGTGLVSVTVTAKDVVGNVAAPVTGAVSVTRVKWVRTMAGKVDGFKAGAIVTSVPRKQIVFGGTERDTCPPSTGPSSCGPIVSLSEDGRVSWRTGHGDIDKIGTNLVYSSVTQQLYVVVDPAVSSLNTNKMFAYHVSSSGVDGSFSCPMVQGVTAGKVFGSPALISDGGTEYALEGDQTLHRLWAFSGAPGIGCSSVSTNGVLSGNITPWAGIIQPPSVNGQANIVYLGHGTTVTPGLAKVTFAGGDFRADVQAPSFSPHVSGTVALAGNLFFGDSSAGRYFSYDATTLTARPQWASSGSGAMGDALTSSPVVSAAYLLGVAGSGDGRLRAFSRVDGTEVFHFPPGTTAAVGALAPPALGEDNVIYVSEGTGPSLLAIAADGSNAAPGWSAYQGTGGTNPDTSLDSITTEPTVDSTGVMYVGTLGGKIFAIITDSTGPLLPVAGSNWPRVGYDNCNSSNTSFACQ